MATVFKPAVMMHGAMMFPVCCDRRCQKRDFWSVVIGDVKKESVKSFTHGRVRWYLGCNNPHLDGLGAKAASGQIFGCLFVGMLGHLAAVTTLSHGEAHSKT